MKVEILKLKEKSWVFIEGFSKKILMSIFKYEDLSHEEKEEKLKIQEIHDAHREWMEKEEYFRFVSDADLVDFAIYDMEASKRKYTYLLKKMKKETNV